MNHELKIYPEHFKDVMLGIKKVEVRLNDRNYQESDILILNEYDPKTSRYTGEQTIQRVNHIVKDIEGLNADYVILQIVKTYL